MILVTGSLAFDHIMEFPGKFAEHIMPEKVHILNLSFYVERMRKSFGGTAGNIAYTLSLLGIKVGILGMVGGDFSAYKKFLEENGIDISYLQVFNDSYTSTSFGITDNSDNQIWGFYPGADSFSDNLSIYEVKEKIDFGIVAPHNPRAMLKFVWEYKKLKIPYLFDGGMQLPWFQKSELKEVFAGAKIIIGNDYEVSLMEQKTGIGDLHCLSKEDKIIITTFGEKGSKISAKGKTWKIKAAKVRSPLDPAGAGDAYRAGFLAGFLRGFPLDICGKMGSVAAAYAVENAGTTAHRFTLEEFEARYKENYGEKIKL